MFPNGQDSSTTSSPEATNDFIENEIFNGKDDKKDFFPTSSSSSTVEYQPTVEYSTRVSFSSSTSFEPISTTQKFLNPIITTEAETTSSSPSTVQTTQGMTRTSSIPATRETFVERNYKLLQQLLEAEKTRNAKPLSTQTPETTVAPPTFTTSEPITEATTETTTRVSTTRMPSTRRILTTSKPTTKFVSVQTTEEETTQASTTKRSTTSTTTTEAPTTVASTTKRIIRTTHKPKTTRSPFSDIDDLAFLVRVLSSILIGTNLTYSTYFQRQLSKFINRQAPTLEPRKPQVEVKTTPTTTTSTTTTTTTTTTTPKPSTSKPVLSTQRAATTFSDADDVAFLNSLVSFL